MYRTVSTLVLAVLVLDSMGGAAKAQSTPPQADRVEEDWELVIAAPDTVGVGPQITTSMSPTGDTTSSPFVAFNLNYREYPYFQPGGLQVQVWSDKSLLSTATRESAPCNIENETITWTQRMSLSANQLDYTIQSGESTTWGKFGQGGQLAVYTDLASDTLATYSPDVSMANSGAGWESNLVTSMKLLRVRYYQGAQLISTDETPRSIPLDN